MITNITKHNFEAEVVSSTQPIVIDVFATWCGPCQHMAPIFEELSKDLGNKYKFLKLNIDEDRELAIDYGISSVPTFVFIKNNDVVGKATGYMAKDALESKIKEFLG